ncbi:hypothetical protein DD238_004559 [Peronospora effusa]|uniref:Uncharacterized protein n=1 Tax=Peronospora effusa TaxID=542832 RepID=A0A3M6VED8_9STRA|nr:hypothetical protein DD238_004559 [Peronospora effusa]RQM14154.1 hypothetical protein DD237_004838 [Peronospora effusa]
MTDGGRRLEIAQDLRAELNRGIVELEQKVSTLKRSGEEAVFEAGKSKNGIVSGGQAYKYATEQLVDE